MMRVKCAYPVAIPSWSTRVQRSAPRGELTFKRCISPAQASLTSPSQPCQLSRSPCNGSPSSSPWRCLEAPPCHSILPPSSSVLHLSHSNLTCSPPTRLGSSSIISNPPGAASCSSLHAEPNSSITNRALLLVASCTQPSQSSASWGWLVLGTVCAGGC